MSWLHFSAGTLALLAALALWLRWVLTPQPISTVPHNFVGRKVPLFGDGPELDKVVKPTGRQQAWFDLMYQRHGGICQVLLPLGLQMVLVSDPALIHQALSLQTPRVFDRDNNVGPLALRWILRSGHVAQPSGELVRNHRRALAPALSKSYLIRFVPRMTRSMEDLLHLWKIKAKRSDGRPFSVLKDCVLTSSDIAGTLLFNHDFGETKSAADLAERIDTGAYKVNSKGGVDELPYQPSQLFVAAEDLNMAMGKAMNFGLPRVYHFFDMLKRSERRRAVKYVRSYLAEQMLNARRVVQERAAAGSSDNETGDSVVMMLAEKEDNAGLRLTLNEVVDELMTLHAAGSETTSFAIMWAVKLLQQNPQAQRQLHEHLVARLAPLDERMPTYEDLAAERVPLLDAVVHEVLRMSAVTGGCTRVVKEDTTLGGHHLPKGTWVLCSVSGSLHEAAPAGDWDDGKARRERGCSYWRNPEVFDPTRWLAADGSFDPHAGPSNVFAEGPRGCWGRAIALLEMKVVIAMLNLSFFLASVPGALDSMNGWHNIAIAPQQCYARPVRWSQVGKE